ALKGKCEELPDGRTRLTYDFEDEAQLADFVRDDGHLAWRREVIDEPEVANDEAKVRAGVLAVIGKPSLRHTLEFEAPVKVRYALEYPDLEADGRRILVMLLVGISSVAENAHAAA